MRTVGVTCARMGGLFTLDEVIEKLKWIGKGQIIFLKVPVGLFGGVQFIYLEVPGGDTLVLGVNGLFTLKSLGVIHLYCPDHSARMMTEKSSATSP